MPQYDFRGRVIAMTGGAGALGSEIALELVRAGARVALLDRAEPGAQMLQAAAESGCADRMRFFRADVLDRASLNAANTLIEAEWGPVDTLINAAGGNHPAATTAPYNPDGGPSPSFFDLTEAGVRAVFDLNFLGTLLPCQVFAQGMVARGEGVILNFSSMNAIRPLTRIPAYSAAKAAVSNFTQWLAVYMAQNHSPRIRVNALAPGFFVTEQSRFLAVDPVTGELSARGRAVVAHTPIGRYGNPDELFGAVMWLLSPASAFVTGAVIPVDGGFSAFSGV